MVSLYKGKSAFKIDGINGIPGEESGVLGLLVWRGGVQVQVGGGRLFVDSTIFLLSVYNLQPKFEQNLHLQINS